jgi:hypothetical protein
MREPVAVLTPHHAPCRRGLLSVSTAEPAVSIVGDRATGARASGEVPERLTPFFPPLRASRGRSGGIGAFGGVGRCYPVWTEFTKCSVRRADWCCLRLFIFFLLSQRCCHAGLAVDFFRSSCACHAAAEPRPADAVVPVPLLLTFEQKAAAHPDLCVLYREDFMECLHRKKMVGVAALVLVLLRLVCTAPAACLCYGIGVLTGACGCTVPDRVARVRLRFRNDASGRS